MDGTIPYLELLQDFAWLPWAILAGAMFLLWKIWRSNARGAQDSRHLQAEPGDDERRQIRELRGEIRRLETESANLSKFLLLLPEFTKQLNSPMERHQLAPLLLGIFERMFEPQQILVFFNDRKVNQLILHAQKGFDERVGRSFRIKIGEGRVGWAAQHQTAMATQDFIHLMRTDGKVLDSPEQSRIRADLVIPMIHEDVCLGVISLGSIGQQVKHEKRVGKMIGDLGSIALYNNMLFRMWKEQANSDGLTKLCNKKFFLYLLGNEIVKAEKSHQNVSLFLFDLDHFKNLNDTYGHLAGDEVLKMTSRIVRDTIRDEDVAARYGGEEFILMLPGTQKEGALIAAEKIRKALENYRFTNEEGKALTTVTMSGGVSTFPEDGRTSTQLIQAADTSLYRAKQGGRNRVLPAEPKYFSNIDDEIIVKTTQG